MSYSSQTTTRPVDMARRNLEQAEREIQNALRSLDQGPPREARDAVRAAERAVGEAQQALQAIGAADPESDSPLGEPQIEPEDVIDAPDELTDLETLEVFAADERSAPTRGKAGAGSNDPTAAVPREELEGFEAETARAVENQAMFESDALRFVGTMAVTADGEDLGEIQELVLGPEGIVQGVLLSIQGSEGLLEREVTLEWGETEVAADGRLVINMSLEDMQQLPAPE